MPKRNDTRKSMYQSLVSREEKTFCKIIFIAHLQHFANDENTMEQTKCIRFSFYDIYRQNGPKTETRTHFSSWCMRMYLCVYVCVILFFFSWYIITYFLVFHFVHLFYRSRLPCSHSHQIKCAWKRVRFKNSNREMLDKQFKLSSCCSDMMIFLLLTHSPLLVVQTLISKKGTI